MDVLFSREGFQFEWDKNKANSNFVKHGVTFEEATEAFLDPFHQIGDASVENEQRAFLLGYSGAERLLLIVHVEREVRIRLISARTATRAERKLYENSDD